VLGNKAASTTSYPKPWVAVIDIVAAVLLVLFSVQFLRRPRDPKRAQSMVDQMSKIASSPWIAIVAAGAYFVSVVGGQPTQYAARCAAAATSPPRPARSIT
jgi:hypothetical protein